MEQITAGIEERTPRGIAAGINRLINDGTLGPGTRLPTVRELARELGISPSTVSEAWHTLAGIGAIEPRGKLGTFVLDPALGLGPVRYRRISEGPGHFRLDLSTGTPDPALLPDLSGALSRVDARGLTTSYVDAPVLPALEDRLRASWPFDPERLTIVDGALDALDRVAQLTVRFGDRVVVENPCFPPLLDLLAGLGAEVMAVEVDEQGIVPAALERALASQPVAVFLQPRAQNPTGASLNPKRAKALARLLRPTTVIVVEDDHSGEVSGAPDVSIGSHLPHLTVRIRSYSKSHGPDLRLAAVAGRGDLIEELEDRRMLGPGWSSRLLQAVLVELLDDPGTGDAVAAARDEYAARRAALREALAANDVVSSAGEGINLWVEVGDERTALVTLAARGIGVAPGSPFEARRLPGAHVRVTVGLLRSGHAELAAHFATAAVTRRRRRL
jgi:DNA-binding transcriptional MocR family regulator